MLVYELLQFLSDDQVVAICRDLVQNKEYLSENDRNALIPVFTNHAEDFYPHQKESVNRMMWELGR